VTTHLPPLAKAWAATPVGLYGNGGSGGGSVPLTWGGQEEAQTWPHFNPFRLQMRLHVRVCIS
jgi:hypothetical protein